MAILSVETALFEVEADHDVDPDRPPILPASAPTRVVEYPIDRYKQLLGRLPRGEFYYNHGVVLPHLSHPQELRLETNEPDTLFGLHLNGTFEREVHTNADGIAVFHIQLPLGDCEITLTSTVTKQKLVSWVTTRDYAVWFAAYAETLGDKDLRIEDIIRYGRLNHAPAVPLESAWGRSVLSPNPGYHTETYRDLVKNLRSAYRNFGATRAGWDAVVSAYCLFKPIVLSLRDWQSWILGKDFAMNPRLDRYTRVAELDAGDFEEAGISVKFIGPAPLGYEHYLHIADYDQRMLVVSSSVVDGSGVPDLQVAMDGTGKYRLLSPTLSGAALTALPEPYHIEANRNRLTFLVDGIVPFTVELPTGVRSAAELALAINTQAGTLPMPPVTAYANPMGSNREVLQILSNTADLAILKRIGLQAQTNGAEFAVFGMPLSHTLLAHPADVGALVVDVPAGHNLPLPLADYAGLIIADPATGDTEVVRAKRGSVGTKLALEAPLHNSYGTGSYLVSAHDRLLMIGEVITGGVEVTFADESALPESIPSAENLPLVAHGSEIPDDVILKNIDVPLNRLDRTLGVFRGEIQDPDHSIIQRVDHNLGRWAGLTATIHVHAAFTGVDDHAQAWLGVSFDDGESWLESDVMTLRAGAPCVDFCHLSSVFEVPEDCSRTWIRLRTDLPAGSDLFIRKMSVTAPTTGHYLGSGTTVRGQHRTKSGELLLCWSPTQLTASERRQLGLEGSGHIQRVGPAHLWVKAADVTEYDGEDPVNVVGAWDEVGFGDGQAVSMEMVLGTPERFTYLRPQFASAHTQRLQFHAVTRAAELEYEPVADQSVSILFEDGIPVLASDWEFANSKCRMLRDPLENSVYELRYQRRAAFTTGVLDLGSRCDDYLWWADWVVNQPVQADLQHIDTTEQLLWSGDLTAEVTGPADTRRRATLTVDNGEVSRTVEPTNWRWLTQSSIQLSPDAVVPDGIYTLQYSQLGSINRYLARTEAFIKSADTEGGLDSAEWRRISQDEPVRGRFHRMRVELLDVVDPTLVQVQAVGIRGIKAFAGDGLPGIGVIPRPTMPS